MRAVFLMDPPTVFDCAVTPIPGSASLPIQVVASAPSSVSRIHVIDGVAEYIALCVGPAGQEVQIGVIGSGRQYTLDVPIGYRARISLRSMTTAVISSGTLSLTFYE